MKSILRLEKSNLSSRTYDQIRSALMNGEYSPGDRIRIANMAESLGISITPVREAIFRLVSEQALEMTAATSITVPELDAATVADIQLMRRLLEGAAAERAALAISKAELEVLSSTHDQFIEAVSGSPADAARINRDFHFQLMAVANMPSLFDIVEGLWVRMGPLLHVFHSHLPVRAISNKNHPHYRVLSGLKKKDPAAVAKAIQEDIAWGERILLEWMSQHDIQTA